MSALRGGRRAPLATQRQPVGPEMGKKKKGRGGGGRGGRGGVRGGGRDPGRGEGRGGGNGGLNFQSAAEARRAAESCTGNYNAGKGRIVRAWANYEVAAGSDCSSFSWSVEKCKLQNGRSVPEWSMDGPFDPSRYHFDFGCTAPRRGEEGADDGIVPRAGQAGAEPPPPGHSMPLEVLVQAALASPDGMKMFTRVMEYETHRVVCELFICLYEAVQRHELTINEFVQLLDALGSNCRREVQLGPILRSINSRSCPAGPYISLT